REVPPCWRGRWRGGTSQSLVPPYGERRPRPGGYFGLIGGGTDEPRRGDDRDPELEPRAVPAAVGVVRAGRRPGAPRGGRPGRGAGHRRLLPRRVADALASTGGPLLRGRAAGAGPVGQRRARGRPQPRPGAGPAPVRRAHGRR